MTKSFGLAILGGIIALCVFAYFIFGFNQTSSDKLVPPTQISESPSPTPDTTGLKIEDTQVGTGKELHTGDIAVIHYTGTFTDGTKFDSSYDRGQPFETPIGRGAVIAGWDIGVVGMKVGGKRKLTIPPSLAYGEQGSGSVPPNATLIFEVELIDVK